VVVALRAEFSKAASDELALALVDNALGVQPGPVSLPVATP
jgi:hypothetical protein